MESKKKGKSSSVSPPFSYRYNAEDEEMEMFFSAGVSETEPSKKINDSLSSQEEWNEINKSIESSPASSPNSKLPEAGSSGEKFGRILKGMRGKFQKKVEDKLDEIKCDPMMKKLIPSSSLSDSEERSETSSSVQDISDRGKEDEIILDSDHADLSDMSLTPDRTTTPVVTEVDVSEGTPHKEGFCSSFSTPERKESVRSQESFECSSNLKIIEMKATSKKVEVGVEAIEESVGQKEGNTVENIPVGTCTDNVDENSPFVFMRNGPVRYAIYFALLGVLYLFSNIPPFLFGLFVGCFLAFEFNFWTCFSYPNENLSNECSDDYPSMLPASLFHKNELKYEGWLNEFCSEYQPEVYHVARTETVYARLNGSIFKLATPRQKISKKAFWNEPYHRMKFDRERTYDISGCEVMLLPEKLAHKRLWSKKYPISIVLKPNSHMGTRYRERGTATLDFVSYKKFSIKSDEDKTNEQFDDGETKMSLKKVNKSPTREDDYMFLGSEDEDEDDSFGSDYVKIPTSLINKNNIYLFTRTDREKDIWFRRLVQATKLKSDYSAEEKGDDETGVKKAKKLNKQYYNFINSFLKKKISVSPEEDSINLTEEDESITWFNIFLGRIMFDTMQDSFWINQIQEKIQKKLSAIKVPPFLEELIVSQVELSKSVPVINKCHTPKIDHDGIWVDLEILYKGNFKMSIDTKIDINKLKKYHNNSQKSEGSEGPETPEKILVKAAIFDSEVEDSAESSGDDIDIDNSKSPKTSQTVMKIVDKIAGSKCFQHVTDIKFVKKAIEGVSNTRISLLVQVKSLNGTIVLNFPPPPSDRLWYGFRPNTKLILTAEPKLGQRGINVNLITNYIEKQMLKEFEKMLVMPNMDDLIIPLMNKETPS